MKRRNFIRSVSVEIVRRACAKREDGQPSCERCGAIGCKLEVHHKVMDAMEIDKARKLTAYDGELLCEPCHDPITSKQRKILAKAQRREASHVGVTRPTGDIKSPGFAPPAKPKREPLPVASGMTEMQRRYGVTS